MCWCCCYAGTHLRIELGGFENDTAACYDRILMNMTGATFEQMGVPEGPPQQEEDVLLNVIHFLNLALVLRSTHTLATPFPEFTASAK
jgi:hypothetical protein